MTPPLLLPYQSSWVNDPARVKLLEKGRQIGASWCTAGFMALEAARRGRGGEDCWYVGYNKEMTREFILDCATWARSFSSGCSEIEESIFTEDGDRSILQYSILFASGHRITALSSRPRSLRNKRGHVIIDEAAFHDDLAGMIKSARANLIWGGDIWVMSSHNGVGSEFNRLLEDCRAGRLRYSVHRVTFDDALKAGLYRRICLATGAEWSREGERVWRQGIIDDSGDDAPEELFCIPVKSGGTYLSRALIESCMYPAPVFRFEAEDGFAQLEDGVRTRTILDWLEATLSEAMARLPRHLLAAFGEDFGRTADLSVLAPVILNQNLSRTVPFLVELRNVPFREQETALVWVVDRLPILHHGALDSGGNGQYLAERAWQRYGEQAIEQVGLTEKWYGENLPKLKAALEDQMLAIPMDADVLADLQGFQVIDGVPRMPKIRKVQKALSANKAARRHGDAAIAIALGHYASAAEIRQYRYESVAGPRARKGLD